MFSVKCEICSREFSNKIERLAKTALNVHLAAHRRAEQKASKNDLLTVVSKKKDVEKPVLFDLDNKYTEEFASKFVFSRVRYCPCCGTDISDIFRLMLTLEK